MPMMSKNPKKEPDLVSIAKQERYKIRHPTTLVRKKQEFLEEKPARSAREIEEIIGTIEQYLVQTREVLDRIEEDITELKKEGKLEIEKDETIPSKKVAAKEVGKTL